MALADAYDAITSLRPYKPPQPPATARDIIQKDSGSHFDPVVVEAFLRRFDTLASVHKQDLDQAPLVIGADCLPPQSLAVAGV